MVKGKVALVTGASSGIGAASARLLATCCLYDAAYQLDHLMQVIITAV